MADKRVPFRYRNNLQGYLTDGSRMQWEDAVPSEVLRHYDFMFDNGPSGNGVPVGNIPLPQSQHPTLEAEWIIYFFDDKGMPSPDDIKPSKHVWLTGMAEAKYMQSFLDDLKSGHILWGPMTVKNDVIAKGDCIETTIDDIANGRVDGEVIVNEITASGEKPFEWRNHACSLRKEKLVEYLQELSKHSQKNQHKPVDFVNLSATDPNSALVNSWPRRIKGIGKSLSFSGEKILQSMFSDAIRKGHYTKSGDLKVIFNGDVIATAKITTTP